MRERFGVALLLPAVLSACSAVVPPVPMDRFLAGDLDVVGRFYEEQLREGDEDSGALFLNGLATIELLKGDVEAARRHFRQAGIAMGNWETSSGEVLGAILGSESSKTWKGDPHEKAMNAYYTGLLYWMRGELDNARASFKSGILADAESDEGGYQSDFALLFWLAGRMSERMGLVDDAESYYREAREAREFAVRHGARGESRPALLADPAGGNLVCVVDVGLGPRKLAGGAHGELAVVVPRAGGPAWAEIFVGGASIGRTTLLADIDYQARTRGGKTMEGIREGKAVFKTVTAVGGLVMIDQALRDHGRGARDKLAVGLGLLALSLFTSATADVRHWEILPRSVHVLRATLPPGVHDLRIEFRSEYGARFDSLTQRWTIEVPESGDSIYYFRSLPGLDHARREVQ